MPLRQQAAGVSRHSMTNNRKLITRTVISNALIVVGAGHGIGFLGLIEVFWLPQFYGIGTEDFSLSIASSYDKTLGIAAILSLLGQLLLLTTLLIKGQQTTLLIKIAGLLLLWTGFFYLTHHLFVDTTSLIGFVTGLPFLGFSGLLLYKTFIQNSYATSA